MVRPSKPINIVSRRLARQVAADIIDMNPGLADEEEISVEDILRYADLEDLKLFAALRAIELNADAEVVLPDFSDTMTEWYEIITRHVVSKVDSSRAHFKTVKNLKTELQADLEESTRRLTA